MSTIPFKSAKVRNAVKGALGAAVATPLLFAALPATAASTTIGDTSVEVGGFVKLESFYDFENDAGTSLAPSDVIANGGIGGYDHKHAQNNWDSHQSRLTVSTTTPTSVGDIGGYFEADFLGADNNLRLRQAYLTWQNWTIGRAWTTFENFHYGTTLNFWGPVGQVFGRTEQIRYTFDMANGDNFDIALEKGGRSVFDSDSGSVDKHQYGQDDDTKSRDQFPALALRYQGTAGDFSYQAAGYVSQLKADQDYNTNAESSDSKAAWAVNAGATLPLPTGTTLQTSVAYGEGVGYLIYAGPAALTNNGGYIDSNGDLQTLKELGVTASIGQKITDRVSANLVYGFGQSKDDNNNKVKGQSIAANVLYSPVEPLVFGVEYSYITADVDGNFAQNAGGTGLYDVDGNGHANRVEVAAIYNF